MPRITPLPLQDVRYEPLEPELAPDVPPDARTARRERASIVHLSLNPDGLYEARALAERTPVYAIHNAPEPGALTLPGPDGRPLHFELTTRGGVDAFAATLPLPPAQQAAVAATLAQGDVLIRDELAQLALLWSRAEGGAPLPSRLVLSGHGYSAALVGEDNGRLPWELLASLAHALPRAAAQIQDVHLAGCNTAGPHALGVLREAFPQLRSLWAYAGTAPGAVSGAATHQLRWERATREGGEPTREAAAHTRLGESVAVWTAAHGYDDGRAPEPLSQVRERVQLLSVVLEWADGGGLEVPDPQRGPLRDFYDALSALLRHPELPAAERPALEAQRDRALRLLYFEARVTGAFARTHAQALQQGYASLGLAAPDFAHLSRRDALWEVDRFCEAAAARQPLPEPARALLPLLVRGLRNLEPGFVPDAWL
ncbi:hypothetical protein FGE12_07840 [Aggregicoccus sp. 17bor-14]|uniref:hypothetical protein n=1 Tax=Myxococcaceae TaxID=31 RepID=UPI00129D0529|nr:MULTISPECIES: hypothetical protein [Myxococcaceae]MBF5042307.1 hypothetical protein [Simulacricoccus sp. 17bor-14]MRI88081.1 hypothetical protein [Aggregicoccus sp. 17bor-14]